MPKLREQTKRIVDTLKLETMPIGVKFVKKRTLKSDHPKVKICEALRLAMQKNLMINISKENCTCSGGRHFMGFEILPVENIAAALTSESHKVYESKSRAVASIKRQPQPVHRGNLVILGPLDKFETNPDLILFRTNPEQADRILGLASFKGIEPFAYYPASSICSIIAYTLAKRKPDINLISAFERQRNEWSPNELVVALPFKNFVTAVESIPYSGFGKRPAS